MNTDFTVTSPICLGISAFYHDSAAALVNESEILGAAQEERFSRIKGDANFPFRAIEELINELKITKSSINRVGYYEKPLLKLQRILLTQLKEAPRGWRQAKNVISEHNLNQYRIKKLLRDIGLEAPIHFFSHHQSHAASAYFPSPFRDAAVLTIDGVGEWSTTSISKGYGDKISLVQHMDFPNSIGLLYATFTSYCGFKVNSGEYKLMGLAPYGQPKYIEKIKSKIVRIFDDGSIELNLQYFDFTRGIRMFSNNFCELFGRRERSPEEMIDEFHCDLAASIQRVLEEILIKISNQALKVTNSKNLVLAGGVALNCVANSKLLDFVPHENFFVQPAAGDAGGALGAAILASKIGIEKKNKNDFQYRWQMQSAFLGTSYSDEEIKSICINNNLVFQMASSKSSLVTSVVDFLESGKVIGWFQGKMEFGPRALGGRSIIADSRNQDMQKRLNLKIKKRESFRPFAPMVLDNKVHEWFEWPANQEAPYMLFTAPVKKTKLLNSDNTLPSTGSLTEWVSRVRSSIPAVTHVDNSARIQTVNRDNPIREVMEKFFNRTKVPVLVNTSFNVRGEPIVESPQNAIDCFLQTDMDVLVIGSALILKSEQPTIVLQQASQRKRIWDLD